MKTPMSADELRTAAEAGCKAKGLIPTSINARVETSDWQVTMVVNGRCFHLGSECREGFFCWEETSATPKNFFTPDFGAPRDSLEELLLRGLRMIEHAIANPCYQGINYPKI